MKFHLKNKQKNHYLRFPGLMTYIIMADGLVPAATHDFCSYNMVYIMMSNFQCWLTMMASGFGNAFCNSSCLYGESSSQW